MMRDVKDESSIAMSTRISPAQPGKAPAQAAVALGGAWAESGSVAAMSIGQIAFNGAVRCGHGRRLAQGSGVQR
jgi:hypothetical protein